MPEGRAQELLDQAIADPDPDSKSGKLYAVDGEWCFVAQRSEVSGELYHGYPVPGGEVPERVLYEMFRAERFPRGVLNRLRRQSALPERYA